MTKHKDPNHIHKLLLHRYRNGKEVYFCTDNCDFKISPELSLGREVICHRCGNPFRMNSYSLTLKKPHCEDCHVRKNDKRRVGERRRMLDRREVSNIQSAVVQDMASHSTESMRSRLSSSSAQAETKTITEEELFKDEEL